MNRCILRPAPEKPGVFFIALRGIGLDVSRVETDVDYLQQYISDITKHPEIKLEKIFTVAEWKYATSIACAINYAEDSVGSMCAW